MNREMLLVAARKGGFFSNTGSIVNQMLTYHNASRSSSITAVGSRASIRLRKCFKNLLVCPTDIGRWS
jgi:hypothetical protein